MHCIIFFILISKKIKVLNIKKNLNWIVHSEAYHRINDFKSKPELKVKKNVLMVKNLVNFMKIKKIKNFIYFSTIDLNFSPYPSQKNFYCGNKDRCEKILLNKFKKKILKNLLSLDCLQL